VTAPRHRRPWRVWFRILHRDAGYLAAGLTIIYAVSGLAVNHVESWNPSLKVEKEHRVIAPLAMDAELPVLVETARMRLGMEEPRGAHQPDGDTLTLFYPGRQVSVDLPTGQVLVEITRPRPVLRSFNQLHLNNLKKGWTWLADLYALALLGLVGTGLFMLPGRKGLAGRGAWLTGLGILIPVVALWLWA
jgi:hypothetical protein